MSKWRFNVPIVSVHLMSHQLAFPRGFCYTELLTCKTHEHKQKINIILV